MLPRRVAAHATPSAATQGTPAGTLGLGIIGIHVADLGASLEFYRRLGLDLPTDVNLGGEAFRLRLPTGQVFFWETIAYTRRDFQDYERGPVSGRSRLNSASRPRRKSTTCIPPSSPSATAATRSRSRGAPPLSGHRRSR